MPLLLSPDETDVLTPPDPPAAPSGTQDVDPAMRRAAAQQSAPPDVLVPPEPPAPALPPQSSVDEGPPRYDAAKPPEPPIPAAPVSEQGRPVYVRPVSMPSSYDDPRWDRRERRWRYDVLDAHADDLPLPLRPQQWYTVPSLPEDNFITSGDDIDFSDRSRQFIFDPEYNPRGPANAMHTGGGEGTLPLDEDPRSAAFRPPPSPASPSLQEMLGDPDLGPVQPGVLPSWAAGLNLLPPGAPEQLPQRGAPAPAGLTGLLGALAGGVLGLPAGPAGVGMGALTGFQVGAGAPGLHNPFTYQPNGPEAPPDPDNIFAAIPGAEPLWSAPAELAVQMLGRLVNAGQIGLGTALYLKNQLAGNAASRAAAQADIERIMRENEAGIAARRAAADANMPWARPPGEPAPSTALLPAPASELPPPVAFPAPRFEPPAAGAMALVPRGPQPLAPGGGAAAAAFLPPEMRQPLPPLGPGAAPMSLTPPEVPAQAAAVVRAANSAGAGEPGQPLERGTAQPIEGDAAWAKAVLAEAKAKLASTKADAMLNAALASNGDPAEIERLSKASETAAQTWQHAVMVRDTAEAALQPSPLPAQTAITNAGNSASLPSQAMDQLRAVLERRGYTDAASLQRATGILAEAQQRSMAGQDSHALANEFRQRMDTEFPARGTATPPALATEPPKQEVPNHGPQAAHESSEQRPANAERQPGGNAFPEQPGPPGPAEGRAGAGRAEIGAAGQPAPAGNAGGAQPPPETPQERPGAGAADSAGRVEPERPLTMQERLAAAHEAGLPEPANPANLAARLPRELAGAKPRYAIGANQYQPAFESDVDKALFIVAQPRPSVRDADYMTWLRGKFPDASDTQIREAGARVRDHIKATVQGQPAGTVRVPDSGQTAALREGKIPTLSEMLDAANPEAKTVTPPAPPAHPQGQQFSEDTERALVKAKGEEASSGGSGGSGGSGEPPKGPGGVMRPEDMPGGDPVVPTFNRPYVEALLKRAKDLGLPREMLGWIGSEMRDVVPEMGRFRRAWSYFWQVVTPAEARMREAPEVQNAAVAGSHFTAGQMARIDRTLHALLPALEEAFGKQALSGAALPSLQQAYEGLDPAGKPVAALVGTLMHVLERPQLYRLTPLQKRAVAEWNAVMDADWLFAHEMGIEMGKVRDSYVPHVFKPGANGEPLDAAIAARGPSVGAGSVSAIRQRVMNLEQLAAYAKEHGLEIETDVSKLLARRLTSMAKLRTEFTFLKELERQGKAAVLVAGSAPPNAKQLINWRGDQWVFPAKIAPYVRDALQGAVPNADDAAISKVLEAIHNIRLATDLTPAFGRHGALAAFADPANYAGAWRTVIPALFSREGMSQFLVQHGEGMAYAAAHGLEFRLNPMDPARSMLLPGDHPYPMANVPLLGMGVKPFAAAIRATNNFQFGMLMPVLKYKTWQTLYDALRYMRDGRAQWGEDRMASAIAMLHEAPILKQANRLLEGGWRTMSDSQLARVASDAANNWLGGLNQEGIGRRNPLRRGIFLAEDWMRANVNSFRNTARRGPEGTLARYLVGMELLLGGAVATGASLALTGQTSDYEPRSTRFMDVKTPWGSIPIMPHAVLIRTIARVLFGAPPNQPGDMGPWETRGAALLDYLHGRLAPPAQIGWGLATNQDFTGKPTRDSWGQAGKFIAKNLVPIVGNTIWDDMDEGKSAGKMAVDVPMSAAGFHMKWTTPAQERDALGDRLVQQEAAAGKYDNRSLYPRGRPQHVADLTKEDRRKFDDAHPDYKAAQDRAVEKAKESAAQRTPTEEERQTTAFFGRLKELRQQREQRLEPTYRRFQQGHVLDEQGVPFYKARSAAMGDYAQGLKAAHDANAKALLSPQQRDAYYAKLGLPPRPENPTDAIAEDYWGTQAPKLPNGRDDLTALAKARADKLKGLDDAQREAVLAYPGNKFDQDWMNKIEQEFEADTNRLVPSPRDLQLKGSLAEYHQIYGAVQAQAAREIAALPKDMPDAQKQAAIKQIDNGLRVAVSQKEKQYQALFPGVTALLQKYGYVAQTVQRPGAVVTPAPMPQRQPTPAGRP